MKLGLAFSGGKDSWACLWLYKNLLNDILVIWVNTGKNYPELLETINKAKLICPNFLEIKTDREAQNELEGLPSDIVPINYTGLGQQITGKKDIKIQSYLGCCYENISKHLHASAKFYGVTHLIRGQRIDENYKSPARDGDLIEGIFYIQPIEDWSKNDVLEFNKKNMELPEHFLLNHSSMDCYDCTAYSHESKDRIVFMQKNHPKLFNIYKKRKDILNIAISNELKLIELEY